MYVVMKIGVGAFDLFTFSFFTYCLFLPLLYLLLFPSNSYFHPIPLLTPRCAMLGGEQYETNNHPSGAYNSHFNRFKDNMWRNQAGAAHTFNSNFSLLLVSMLNSLPSTHASFHRFFASSIRLFIHPSFLPSVFFIHHSIHPSIVFYIHRSIHLPFHPLIIPSIHLNNPFI